jgi:hypothetical protein
MCKVTPGDCHVDVTTRSKMHAVGHRIATYYGETIIKDSY